MKHPHRNFRQPHCQTHEISSYTIFGGNCHKYNFCCNEIFVMTNTCLLQRNTSFVVTKVCLSRQSFCHDKHMFVATNVCCDKCFVTPSILFVATKDMLWCDKHMSIATNTCLLRQIFYLWQPPPMIPYRPQAFDLGTQCIKMAGTRLNSLSWCYWGGQRKKHSNKITYCH